MSINHDTVGWLRNQASFCPPGEFVEVRGKEPKVKALVEGLVVSRIYEGSSGKRDVLVIEVSRAARAKGTVGAIRRLTALMPADDIIEIRGATPDVTPLVVDLVVVRSYPDTVNKKGEWQSTFVIEVAERTVPA